MSCSKRPDILVGPGDTSPALRVILLDPQGQPMSLLNSDLTPFTVFLRYQPWDGTVAFVQRSCTVLQSSLTVDVGLVQLDWLASGGAVVPAGIDWRARFISHDNAGHQESFPMGVSNGGPPGEDPAWLWMQTGADFVVP